MLSWWWALPLGVAAAGAGVLSVLAVRLRREAAAVGETADALRREPMTGRLMLRHARSRFQGPR